jgi:hypothetical protein
MLPEASANLEIGYVDDLKNKVCINAGHNILNRKSRVNIGRMLQPGGFLQREFRGGTV